MQLGKLMYNLQMNNCGNFIIKYYDCDTVYSLISWQNDTG